MNLTLRQLREVVTRAGVNDHTIATAMAATLYEESHGDPMQLGDRRGSVPTSFGIGQVHEPDHPEIAAATRAVMAVPGVSSWGKAVAEVKLLLPIAEDSAKQAIEAARVLRERGFPVDLSDTLVLMDAAWQGPGIVTWARETGTGDPTVIRDGTSPGRGARVRKHLAMMGIATARKSWVLPVALLLGGGLLTWAAVEAVDRKKRR